MYNIAVLLIAQAVSGQAEAIDPTIRFDLAQVKPVKPCENGAAQDIVVCARNGADANRLQQLPAAEFEQTPAKAEMNIVGAVKGAIVVESKQLGPVVSQRAMVRIAVPF
jgi:hypothetical protein